MCPTLDQLERLLNEELGTDEQVQVGRHVSECLSCQSELERLSPTVELAWSRESSSAAEYDGARDPGLRLLINQLREHPPQAWLEAGTNAVASHDVTFAGPVSDEAPLGWLDSYQVLREVGSGVTGQVFAARDSRLGRIVALKVLRPYLVGHSVARARFEREARAIAAIKDPHIVAVFEVGLPLGFPPYMVMEFVAGVSLATRLQRERVIPPREAARIGQQIGRGLEAAHQQGVVHRDVKSSNVLLDSATGRAKIVDFGLARLAETTEQLTHEGLIAGTPAYMSPEQIRRPHAADGCSDVYSAGVILYEMLTGEQPFRGVLRRVLFQVLNDEPVAPRRLNDRIPRDLETICLTAMSKEPAGRYATAAEFADDLQRWLDGQPIRARPIGPIGRAWRWCWRNPKLAAINVIVASVLLAGLIDFARYASPSAQLRRDADIARQEAERLRQLVEQQRGQLEQLTQTLVFDAQDAAADQPESWTQRKLLLETAVNQLSHAGVNPLDDSTRHTLAVAHNRLGDLFRQRGEWDRAEQHYRTAWQLSEERTSSLPDQQRLHARLLAALAATEWQLGKSAEAEGHAHECLDQLDQWAAQTSASREIFSERLRVADVLWRIGRHDEAIQQTQDSLNGLRSLSPDPPEASARREHIGAAGQLANYLIATKAFEAARPVLEQAASSSENLLAGDSAELTDHKSHVTLQRNLALVEFHLGRATDARRRLLTLEKHLRQLQADARWTTLAENRNWIEAQRREVLALAQ